MPPGSPQATSISRGSAWNRRRVRTGTPMPRRTGETGRPQVSASRWARPCRWLLPCFPASLHAPPPGAGPGLPCHHHQTIQLLTGLAVRALLCCTSRKTAEKKKKAAPVDEQREERRRRTQLRADSCPTVHTVPSTE